MTRATLGLQYLGTGTFALDIALPNSGQAIHHIFQEREVLGLTDIVDITDLQASSQLASLIDPARAGGPLFALLQQPGVDDPFSSEWTDRTIYVGPDGSDSASGTAQEPVATLERALDLLATTWREATTIQLGWDAATQAVVPQVQSYTRDATFFPYPVGGRASPLVILGGFTDALGTRTVSAAHDVDPGAGTAVVDLQDDSLATTIPAGLTGTFIAGAPSGQIRLSDPSLIGELADVAVGDMWLVALANSPGNNSTFTVTAVNDAGGTLDLRNSQGVVADANNGAIYSQRSYEGAFLRMTSGANADIRRIVRDHGVEAQATFTEVALADHADADELTISGLDAAGVLTPVTLLYRVTGGGPAVGPTTIDLTGLAGGATAADVAAVTRATINALLPSVLPVRASAIEGAEGAAKSVLKQMMLGAGANGSAIEKDGGATWIAAQAADFGSGTEVSDERPGFGTPRDTFRVNKQFTSAISVGDTFVIQRPNCQIDYGAANRLVSIGGGAVAFKGVVFNNVASSPSSATLQLFSNYIMFEMCEFRLNGGTLFNNIASTLSGSRIPISEFFQNAESNPFFTTPQASTYEGAGIFLHDGNLTNGVSSSLIAYLCLRNINFTTSGVTSSKALVFLDAKRTRIQSIGGLFMFGSGVYFARMDGQQNVSASSGVLQLTTQGFTIATSLGALSQLEIINSGGDGIRCSGGARFRMSSLIGFGNAGLGIRLLGGAKVEVVSPGTGIRLSGESGDLQVGTRSVKSYADMNSVEPAGIEADIYGDASRLSVELPDRHISESRLGTIAAAASFVDIQFGTGMNGAPVIATLNTVDGTALQVLSAVWQGSDVLRVTVDAAATGDVVVSATATHLTT